MGKLKLFVLGILLACSATIPPQAHVSVELIPTDIVESYDAPDIYKTWWKEISDCAGIKADLDRITWWRIGKEHALNFECPIIQGWCMGWWKPTHEIYIAHARMYMENTIKHEMLHDLLNDKNLGTFRPHHALFKKCKVI